MVKVKIDSIQFGQGICMVTHSNRSATFFIRPNEIKETSFELRHSDDDPEISREMGTAKTILWVNQHIMDKLSNLS